VAGVYVLDIRDTVGLTVDAKHILVIAHVCEFLVGRELAVCDLTPDLEGLVNLETDLGWLVEPVGLLTLLGTTVELTLVLDGAVLLKPVLEASALLEGLVRALLETPPANVLVLDGARAEVCLEARVDIVQCVESCSGV
jgi:hypothetical protein